MTIQQLYALLISISLVSALIVCGLYNKWIIIQLPNHTTYDTSQHSIIYKKEITLHYYHRDTWKHETQERLWSENSADNIMELINAWLILLDEEHIITTKTMLQSVLLSESAVAYLSFDHHILNKQDSLFNKWMVIEGLLKTLYLNDIHITSIQFLVHHQPLQDAQLDFSLPWPLEGFMRAP